VAARKAARRTAPTPQAGARAAHRFVPSAQLPWFPFLSEGIHLKLLKVNPSTGEMVLMIRVQPGAGLGTHYHHGVVVAYTISGHWRYRDAEWIAGPGDAIIEPAGSTRAFETVGDAAAESFVHLRGALEFRDEAGKTLCIENAETLHGRYLAHCALHGIEPVDVTAF
jgi:2,4'-dihydroxyacetophenone dioxygenase